MIWQSCLFFRSSVAPLRWGQLTGAGSLLSPFVSTTAAAQHPCPRNSWAMVRGLLLGITGSLLWALPGAALPQEGSVSTGQVEIQQPNAEKLNIVQASERAVINWNSFNIGASEWVNFQQPNATSATLNRVTGGFTSEIAGRLTANGQVYLVNPNGILFTPTAQINVGSFLATTLDIQNTDFMQGQLRFRQTPGMSLSTVENEGNITVADGGFAALVAPGVANRGVINAYLGSVVLGSGTEATLDFYGDGLFSFAVDPTLNGHIFGSTGQPLKTLVSNSGSITADGGVVRLSAQAGASVVNNVINMDGVILARTAENRQGTVVLSGGNTGTVAVSGTIDVSGQASGQTGGTLNVLGSQLNLAGQAQLLASGNGGGGTVLVGGDYQGKGNTPTAQNTTIGEGVQIKADALNSGNGGKVIAWSNGLTTINGSISAMGGANGGNGGLVETSGKGGLSIDSTASVNLSAKNGESGTWLLDPDRLFINSGSTANALPGPATGDYSVAASVVAGALNAGNVTLAANSLIQVDAPINTAVQLNGNTLKFADQNADSNLTVKLNAPISLALSQKLTGDATVVDVSQAFPGIVQNGVDLATAGATLNVASGTFTGNGFSSVPVVLINKDLTIQGQGASNTIFDGKNTQRVFAITAGTVNLDGLTITNGRITGVGAGILVSAPSKLTVSNSNISGNYAVGSSRAPDNTTGFGGGVYSTGTIVFKNDIIANNTADLGGGGIVNLGGRAELYNSTVTGSKVNQGLGAGGIGNVVGTLVINNSTISSNKTNGNYAGGLANGGGTVTITNSTFLNNEGTNYGAISNSDISGTAPNGEVLNGEGKISISNSTISGNQATQGFGGGIANLGGDINITNNTITNNSAQQAGGIFNADFLFSQNSPLNPKGTITIGNSIVAGNNILATAEGVSPDVLNNGTFTSLGFNLVGQNGSKGGFPSSSADIVLSGSINTVIAPLADNGGLTQTHALVAGSSAIDAGNNALAVDPTTGQPLKIDQRGGERAPTGLNAGSNVDIGAYEATSSTVVTNTGDDNSLGNLRSAVSFANRNLNTNPLNISAPAPNTIKFDTAGVFSTPQTIGLRLGEIIFNNPNTAVALQGTGASNLIISGNNVSRVFSISKGTVALNKLTLSKGNTINGGGGIFSINSNITILESVISDNSAGDTGGGIFNSGGSLRLISSKIAKNTSVLGAGGLDNRSGDLTLVDSTVSDNNVSGSAGAGGIGNIRGTLTITNSTISNNKTTNFFAAGVANRGGKVTISNSTISQNIGGNGGGGVSNGDIGGSLGTLTITNSTIVNNGASNGGGIFNDGIGNENSPAVVVKNSIIAGNSSPLNSEVSNSGNFTSLGNNLVGQNGSAGGFPTIASDFVLKGSIETAIAPLADNGGPTQTHALVANSPAVDRGSVIPGLITDQRGAVRPQGNAPDIGAVESGFTRAPDVVENGKNDSSQIIETIPSSTATTGANTFTPVSIPQPIQTPLASAPVQELDQYFSASITSYLGLKNAPTDTIDQAKNTLSQISAQVAGVTPSLIYTYFAPAPKAQTAAKFSPTLIASAEPLSGLLAQASAPKADKCLSEKPARPTDPIWQLDSCGWDRIFPKGAAGNENDQLVLVLVTSDGKVVRKQIPDATRGKMVKAVRRFQGSLQQLRDANTYLPQSQQLYSWLVAPLEESLKAAKVNNLVFIMDKGLRALPLAALHDGTGFIVERYSVGVMPSLTLTDTRHVNLQQTQVLAMGASEFKDLAALPAVPLELSTIGKLWSGQSLLNETFTPQQLKQLRSSTSYGIVHLATHGEFQAGRPEQSYIQFWDTKVNLKQMSSLNLTQPSPVSLLVLSACRTALGDQDAELGFTGLAVSAGVQTALGGLWNISDLGTLALMSSFYGNLKTAPIKAEALRQAQVAMLKGQVRVENNQLMSAGLSIPLSSKLQEQSTANLAHPFYWSGITMVGNPW